MQNHNLPANIKRKILFSNIFTIALGAIFAIAMFVLKQFVIENYIDDVSILKMFNIGLLISIILTAIFLIAIPALVLLTGIESKKIKQVMKEAGIGERELSIDFDNTKPMGKLKVGDLCAYCRSGYLFTIIPKQHILWIEKETKTNKQKRVSRAMDGTIKAEKYTISERKRYVVTIHTLYGRAIVINCNLEKYADAIVQHFSIYDHILFGTGSEYRKEYKKLKKQKLNELKEFKKWDI